jgi:hypothetical protein
MIFGRDTKVLPKKGVRKIARMVVRSPFDGVVLCEVICIGGAG